MTSREAAAVIERTATVILPVGTVEMHGGHMPLGCDGFISQAFALRVAEQIDAAVAPMEHYSFVGATAKFPGSVSVSYTSSVEFLKQVVRGLFAAGFRKVLLISVHYPNMQALSIVAREIFEETGAPVVNINPGLIFDEDVLSEILGTSEDALAEATVLAGALRILGKESTVDPSKWTDEEHVPVEPESLRRIQKVGGVGYYYRSERSHQPSRADVDPAKGVKIIERAVEAARNLVSDLDEYMDFLADNPPSHKPESGE
jgi:creatinine amidohydrolase